MPSVRKLTSDDFPEVYESLLRKLDPNLAKSFWEQAFVDRGWSDEDYYGYLLTDAGQMVGLLGTLFSRRMVGETHERYCNLHSWLVLPEFRAFSLLLMRPVLALKNHVITDLSATSSVVAISERLGFRKLAPTIRVLYSLPWQGTQPELFCELNAADPRVSELLSPAEARIFYDHQTLGCGHLLLQDGQDYCYLVYSKIDGCRVPHCSIHYLSNPDLFARYHVAIRSHLLRGGGRYVSADTIALQGHKIPYSLRADAYPKLYRTSGETPPVVDSLYSEMPIFKLPVYPRLPSALRTTAKRVLRWKRSLRG